MNKFLANFENKLFDRKKNNSQSKKQPWKIIRGCGGSMFKLKFCKLVSLVYGTYQAGKKFERKFIKVHRNSF